MWHNYQVIPLFRRGVVLNHPGVVRYDAETCQRFSVPASPVCVLHCIP